MFAFLFKHLRGLFNGQNDIESPSNPNANNILEESPSTSRTAAARRSARKNAKKNELSQSPPPLSNENTSDISTDHGATAMKRKRQGGDAEEDTRSMKKIKIESPSNKKEAGVVKVKMEEKENNSHRLVAIESIDENKVTSDPCKSEDNRGDLNDVLVNDSYRMQLVCQTVPDIDTSNNVPSKRLQ